MNETTRQKEKQPVSISKVLLHSLSGWQAPNATGQKAQTGKCCDKSLPEPEPVLLP